MTIENCLFKDNIATDFVVVAYSRSIEFSGVNEFIGNSINSSGQANEDRKDYWQFIIHYARRV